MALLAWYKITTPREDLRAGEPLDAGEFAIHLDQVLNGCAPKDYGEPDRFFSKTYLTEGLASLISEVQRRLSGEILGTSSVISLTTQFGGGKTHALTLLYHLAKLGPEAIRTRGVDDAFLKTGITKIPKPAVAVFVGTDFDFVVGRGDGSDEPVRKTPWGEIAWQLGGIESFRIIEKHDQEQKAPAKEIIRAMLPKDKPILVLMDEVLSFMSRARAERVGESTLASQFYNFLQNLSEEASARTKMCVILALPKSELEMTPEDVSDFARLQKLATRVGKPYVLSEGPEIAEIIRRRLFEDLGPNKERLKVAKTYAEWILANRDRLPKWFSADNAEESFASNYPFHPIVLSVFQRKWQGLPQFQRTRGILRMLALWVSATYREGFTGAFGDPLITLGSAPLEDLFFRAEIFDELGEKTGSLEEAVISDIAGKEAHSTALDFEAIDSVKNARLHKKIATSILFESSGGQIKEFTTEPEIRLAVGDPNLDIAHIETALDALMNECYYLKGEGRQYWISPTPNINKLLSDRRASISSTEIGIAVEDTIKEVFSANQDVRIKFFPVTSSEIQDSPSLTLAVLHPAYNCSASDKVDTKELINKLTAEYGLTARKYKSGIIWSVADGSAELEDAAREYLAYISLHDDASSLRLSDAQKKELIAKTTLSQRRFKEDVWKVYTNVVLLDKDNSLKLLNLGEVRSSASESLIRLILTRLTQEGDLEDGPISPSFLKRSWPPALLEWDTKSLRDSFYASPKFPRLLHPESLKSTIAQGVTQAFFGYCEKAPDGTYINVVFDEALSEGNVELSPDTFLIPSELAEALKSGKRVEPPEPTKGEKDADDGGIEGPPETQVGLAETVSKISWDGDLPPQKFVQLYSRVLSYFGEYDIRIKLGFEIESQIGIPKSKVKDAKRALKDLRLSDDIHEQAE